MLLFFIKINTARDYLQIKIKNIENTVRGFEFQSHLPTFGGPRLPVAEFRKDFAVSIFYTSRRTAMLVFEGVLLGSQCNKFFFPSIFLIQGHPAATK